MNKILIALLVAGLSSTAISTAALAQSADFDTLDTNDDGTLNLSEVQVSWANTTQADFTKADSDGNGALSTTEFPALVATGDASAAASTDSGAMVAPATDFESVDTNDDGTVSLSEAQVVWANVTQSDYTAADADGNGALSTTEFTLLKATGEMPMSTEVSGAMVAPMTDFESVDADDDGTVSLSEAQLIWPSLDQSAYLKADADGNGKLSSTEYSLLLAANPPA